MDNRLIAGAAGALIIFAGRAVAAAEPPPPEAPLATSPLDAYAGFYLLADRAVLAVRREGDHLSAQLTGQPAAPFVAAGDGRFVARELGAEITFHSDAAGRTRGLTLRQHGADLDLPRIDEAQARQVTARTEARVKAQAASPGSAEAVRSLEAGLAAGAPPYAQMSPALAEATRAQLPKLQAYLASLGAMQEVRFLGVDGQGADVYDVRHAKGFARWAVALGPGGKITAAVVTQGP